MKIYLDLVFLLNFFFDFLLLFATTKILKEIVPLRRILFGSLVAALTILVLFIDVSSFTLFLIKVILSIIIILITFGKRNFLKNISYFYLLSIILGGSLYLFRNTLVFKNKGLLFVNNGFSINFILLLVVSPIIIFCYVKEHILYRNTYGNIYEVEIIVKNKVYKLRGIIDTGNRLKDPYSKRDVILVNNNIKINGNKFIYVPYKALNTTGIIKCYKVDKVIIKNQEFKNCLIGISKDKISLNDVDCILPNSFKEDL